jgi:hypothetical protein
MHPFWIPVLTGMTATRRMTYSKNFRGWTLGLVITRAAFTSIGQSDRRGGFIRSVHLMLSRNSTRA